MKRQRGFSLVEMAVTTAIFGVFLLILVSLEGQLRRLERGSRVQLMAHPENVAVLTRLRRDTLDAVSYPASFAGEFQTPQTLLLKNNVNTTIVWKFGSDRATRFEYSGSQLTQSWTANGVPRYQISSYELPDGATAVRIQGLSHGERLMVDAIFQPRTQ